MQHSSPKTWQNWRAKAQEPQIAFTNVWLWRSCTCCSFCGRFFVHLFTCTFGMFKCCHAFKFKVKMQEPCSRCSSSWSEWCSRAVSDAQAQLASLFAYLGLRIMLEDTWCIFCSVSQRHTKTRTPISTNLLREAGHYFFASLGQHDSTFGTGFWFRVNDCLLFQTSRSDENNLLGFVWRGLSGFYVFYFLFCIFRS